jgi:muramoyltetrapeptide carboxypeptidase
MKKHIYIYSPSGAVRDKVAFRKGLDHLKQQGHEVEVDEAALVSQQRFAGKDDIRLAAIHRAAASGADVALISRGGYGLSRLLPSIQYKRLSKAIERGTQFVGLSDFTALQLALLAQIEAMTWAGPNLCEGFGAREGVDDIMQACFDDMLLGQGEGAGWRQHKESAAAMAQAPAFHQKRMGDAADFRVRDGLLWGGNLAVLCSLMGTPYFPKIDKGILFLEDVGEHPYRIERMLTQLMHSGVLAKQKAIVMGQFTDYKLAPHDKGYNFNAVVAWLRSQVKTPILTNLPFGHVQTKVMLPVGVSADLLVQGRDALLLWGHV